MDINLLLTLFAGAVLLVSMFSTPTQKAGFPGPLLTIVFGVLIGPHVLAVLDIDAFGVPSGLLLEEAARITLGVSLAGVALRLPHGYWRANLRWVTVIIGLGMVLMLVVATGVLWLVLGLPFLLALLVGAILTPTDPVVTTPLVTGSMARDRIPDTVRHDLSSESGISSETLFISWFGPIGISALFYATLAERLTGNHDIFVLSTLAIVCSVVVHGISTSPFSAWLASRRSPSAHTTT